ncbi:hypothetical protein MMC31_000711 [Peltigera leucophlebia]|nr:hypothetical protein [Peltigera leucophlebia]
MSTEPQMKAVDIKGGKGGADALFINDATPKPQLIQGSSQALVKIKAFGLNRMDLLQREGHYPIPPQAPKTLGVEFSGVVESLGNGEEEGGFKVGHEVFGLAYGGAYAEYISVSTNMLLHKPKELSWEQAAGIPETWITSLQAFYVIGEFTAGKTILWHAGASSVSIAGIQLSIAQGASAVYITAGSSEKVKFCTQTLGATAGYNYHSQDWAKEVLAATDGKGVDIIIDFVGQNYFQQNLDAVAKDGRIVHLGSLSGTKLPAGVDIGAFVRKRIRFEGSSLRSRDEGYQRKLRDLFEEHALPGLRDGRLKVFIERVYPWEEVVEAQKLLEQNGTMGKVICTVATT